MAVVAAVFTLHTTQAAAPAPLEQAATCALPANGQNTSPSDGTALLVNMVEGPTTVEALNTWIYVITQPGGSTINAYCTNATRPRSTNTPSLCFDSAITDPQVVYLMTKYPPSLTSRVDQAARQAAVWHYINGFDLQSPDSTNGDATTDAAVLAQYNALLTEVNAINAGNLPGNLQPGPLAMTITPPAADNTLPAQTASPFTVQVTKGGFPVAGVPVTVTTTFGTLNQANATTDAGGRAVFTVTSSANGSANLAAISAVQVLTVSQYIENQPSGLWQPYGGPTGTVESVGATAVVTWTGAPPPPGQITLTKTASGTTNPWSFSFTLNGANQQTVTNAAPTVTWANLASNQTYTLTEVLPLPANWSSQGVSTCTVNGVTSGDADANLPGFQVLVPPGGAVACTAANVYTPPGQITLTKTATGTAAPWAFSFTLNGADQKTATNTAPIVTWADLAANQTYTLTEVLPLPVNWSQGTTSCTVNGATLPDADSNAPGYQIVVTPGAAVACTAANIYTPPPGQVSLTKSVTGTTAPWSFSFALNGNQKTATNDAPTVTWPELIPDLVYTLTEVLPLPANYTAGPIACAIGGTPTTDADSTLPGFQILVTPGAIVTCTAQNTYTPPPAQISVTKTVSGTTAPWSFTFTLNGANPQVATTSSPTVTWANLTPNTTYTIAEQSPGTEWVAGSFSCTVNGTPVSDADGNTPGFQVTVGPGASVACTINNTKLPPPPNSGTITLTKSVAGPVTAPWSFTFTLSNTVSSVPRTATNAAPVVTWSNLTPNQTYTLTEVSSGLPYWTAGPISCTVNGVSTPDASADPGFQIVVTSGAAVECAATNTYQPPAVGQIRLTKTAVGTQGNWAFAFTLNGTNTQTATTAAPTITWSNLTPDQTYTVAEVNPGAGWIAGPISCTLNGEPLPDASPNQGFQVLVTPGAVVACAATNTAQTGRISLTKVVTTTSEDWSFVFQLQDQPGTKVATKAQPEIIWDNLTPGRTYDLSEVDPGSAWTPGAYQCALLNGEPVGTVQPNGAIRIAVQPGDRIFCLKYNSNVPGTGLPVTPEPNAKEKLFLPTIRN